MTATPPNKLPVWFLDVDGVLNAVTWHDPIGYEIGNANGYTIKWDPRVIDRIRRIHDSGKIQIVWLTTWGSDANKELAPLFGLPEFEVAAEPPEHLTPASRRWWKWDVVEEWYDGTGKYIWTDDDLAVEPAAIEWSRNKNFLCIAPPMASGLTLSDLDNITKFIGLTLLQTGETSGVH